MRVDARGVPRGRARLSRFEVAVQQPVQPRVETLSEAPFALVGIARTSRPRIGPLGERYR